MLMYDELTQIWKRQLSNPLGLAAGYDKHAEAMDALFGFGFGLVEVGSITPEPQVGNPTPRMFRLLEDEAVINRYGFNSLGHFHALERLQARVRNYLYHHPEDQSEYVSHLKPECARSLLKGKLLGVNLGKNKTSPAESDQDYLSGIERLGDYADYLVINISSPNTPGLRALQRREPIQRLLQACKDTRDAKLVHQPPLLVKIAPDVSETELEDIAYVAQQVGIDGIIISNTTLSRKDLKSDPKLCKEMGGLSGAPLFNLSLKTVSKFYQLTRGQIPIIGCGGIRNGQDALAFCKSGASLVQVYTALGYQGPGLVVNIKQELQDLLSKQGKTWQELIGSDHT